MADPCSRCQRAGKDCDAYDPLQPLEQCSDYRQWTRDAMQAAQHSAAEGDRQADWARLCRLIELEQRLGL